MRIHKLPYLIVFILLLGCSKSEEKSYVYWNNLVNEKYAEIGELLRSVPCTSIDAFEIVKKGNYYLVHPSTKQSFEKLYAELEQLEKERGIAGNKEGWIGDKPLLPNNPPIGKICKDGIAQLVFAKDLTLDEVNALIPNRYEAIQDLLSGISCTDASQWSVRYLWSNCSVEAVAVHKSIKSEELNDMLDAYNRLWERRISLERPTDCDYSKFVSKVNASNTIPVICKEGKPEIME